MSFLKKKSEAVSPEATVSSLPVPPSDSALVIDLPEGQKLVLGKMAEGTVIEVATWRGTGRPDSRTNRLMLGVSIGGQHTEEKSSSESIENLTTLKKIQLNLKFRFSTIFNLAQNVSNFLAPKLKAGLVLLANKLKALGSRRIANPKAEIESSTENLESDLDIEKWLESLRTKSRSRVLIDGDQNDGAPDLRKNASKSHSKSKRKNRNARNLKSRKR